MERYFILRFIELARSLPLPPGEFVRQLSYLIGEIRREAELNSTEAETLGKLADSYIRIRQIHIEQFEIRLAN